MATLLEDVRADLVCQTRVLPPRGELDRRDAAVYRVGPPQQSLQPEHPTRREIDDRLVRHPELVVADRATQVLLELEPAPRAFPQLDVEARVPAPALRLRLVHGEVR